MFNISEIYSSKFILVAHLILFYFKKAIKFIKDL